MTYKTLRESIMEVARPKPPGEAAFKDKHVVQKIPDANGNKNDVFNGTKIKEIDRKATFHGYSAKESEDVYEDGELITDEDIEALEEGKVKSFLKKAGALAVAGAVGAAGMAGLKNRDDGIYRPGGYNSGGVSTWVNDRLKFKSSKRYDTPKYSSDSNVAAWGDSKKYRRESVEINELSKKTLGRYIKKAAPRAQNRAETGGYMSGLKADPNRTPEERKYLSDKADKYDRLATKRTNGLIRAGTKLAKEETDLSETPHLRSADFKQIMVLGPNGKVIKRKIKSQLNVGRPDQGGYSPDQTYESIDEAMKLLGTHENGNRMAKVYRDTEWDDHIVKYHTNGVHHKKADSHHYEDSEDAHDSAKNWIRKANESIDEAYYGHKDGYHVYGGREHAHHGHYSNINSAKAAANKLEVQTGYIHQVHHYKGGHLARIHYQNDRSEWMSEKQPIHESVEINELSKKTLGSYIGKAVKDSNRHNRFAVRWPKDAVADYRRADKRTKGIDAAVKQLTKEETDLQEISVDSKYAYLRKVHDTKLKTKQELSPKRNSRVVKVRQELDDHHDKQRKANDDAAKQKVLNRTPQVHDLRHMSHGEVYDHTQTSDKIHDGDVLHVKGGSAILSKAWPIMVKGHSKVLHHFADGHSWEHPSESHYKRAVKIARSLKEETEINEVSARLLGRYLKKGIMDYGSKQRSLGVWGQRPNKTSADHEEGWKFEKKTNRRGRYLDKAADKLQTKPGDK